MKATNWKFSPLTENYARAVSRTVNWNFCQPRRHDSLSVSWALILPLIAMLTSCSSSPSGADGERAIQEVIKKDSEGRIKLVKFQKTNGANGELRGFKMYALEFDAEIEFAEDCKWLTGTYGQSLSFRTSKPVAAPKSGFSWNKFADDTQNPGELVTKGQKVLVSGVVSFVKKEKGWAAEIVGITSKKGLTAASKSSNGQGDPRRQNETCKNNLTQIGFAVRIWSNEHNEVFPPDFLSMSNEIVIPRTLVCPSDTSKSAAKNWSEFKPLKNVSYEFLTPNAKEMDAMNKPAFRCPTHGHVCLGNGSVQ